MKMRGLLSRLRCRLQTPDDTNRAKAQHAALGGTESPAADSGLGPWGQPVLIQSIWNLCGNPKTNLSVIAPHLRTLRSLPPSPVTDCSGAWTAATPLQLPPSVHLPVATCVEAAVHGGESCRYRLRALFRTAVQRRTKARHPTQQPT